MLSNIKYILVLAGLILAVNYAVLYTYHAKYVAASIRRVVVAYSSQSENSTTTPETTITTTTTTTTTADFVIDESGKLRNPEWEQLNKYDFFRRSMAYFFVERSLLRVYFVTMEKYFLDDKSNTTYAVELRLKYADQVYTLNLPHTVRLFHDVRGQLELDSLNVEGLDLMRELNAQHQSLNLTNTTLFLANVKLKMFVHDTKHNLSTHHSIDVRINHNSRMSTSKRGSLLCTYCYFYGNSTLREHYHMFLYWIELNKKFGYEKIAVCNHSFPHNKEFNELFAKHRHLVQVYQLKYVPNFLSRSATNMNEHEHVYLTSFNDMHWSLTVPLEVLMYNQCYMDHSDTYKYISINGADELIIPRTYPALLREQDTVALVTGLNMENINDKRALSEALNVTSICPAFPAATTTTTTETATLNQTAPIELYLQQLERIVGKNRAVNFHFGMGHYLRHFTAELILTAFDAYLNSSAFKLDAPTHILAIVDTSFENFTYTLVINGQRELTYMRNLAKIYRLLTTGAHQGHPLSTNSQYSRFMFVSGDATGFLCGKTIYNTERVLAVNIHYPDKHESIYELTFFNHWNDKLGLDSHFRQQYTFEKKPFRYDDIKIDLNYFFCYYRHVFKELTGVDVLLD